MVCSTIPVGDGSGDIWEPATDQFVNDIDNSDTFGADWARRQQARLFAVDRKAKEWAESTVLLTATASTQWPGSNDPIPPVVHLNQGILSSAQARQKALSRALSGKTWRALRVLGAGQNGHVHAHTAVYIGTDVGAELFDGWVSAHNRNSVLADSEAHESGAIEVQSLENNDRGLVGYTMANCPGLDTRGEREHGITSAPTEHQRGAVVLDRVDVSPLTYGRISTTTTI